MAARGGHRSAATWGVALCAAAALSACSSTTKQGTSPDGALKAGSGPSAAADASANLSEGSPNATAAGSPAAPGTAGGASRSGSTVSGGGSGTTTGGRRPGAPAPGAASGLGVTATEIKIGVTLVENGGSFGALIGVPTDFGNSKAQFNAVADYVNAHGGIAGRKIKPVFYTFDLGKPSPTDGQAEQEACAAWTEDDHVFAVINTSLARLTLLACLAKHGVPGIHDQMPIDEQTLAPYRDYYYTGGHVGGMTLDRLARTSTQVFAQRGLFGKNAVVGILHYDDPAYVRVVNQQYRPALKAAGVTKVVTQAAPRFVSGNYASYVAAFQAAGVTHVMFLGEAGGYPLMFMQAAENQQYRPKYGLRSDNFPANVLQAAAPSAQLLNAMAMGWMPTLDTDQTRDPGPVSKVQSLCVSIEQKAGQDMSSRGSLGSALGYCNGLFFLRDSLAGATSVTPAALAAGVARLGTGFVSPQIYATRYSSQRHDGVGGYRDLAFKADCSCFTYTSGVKHLS